MRSQGRFSIPQEEGKMHNRSFLAFSATIIAAGTMFGGIFDDLPPKPQQEGFGDIKFTGGTLSVNRKNNDC